MHGVEKSEMESLITGRLLAWYDSYGRDLPWRIKGGLGNPYHVWLSEIMLQQTTVTAVKPYFETFIQRWPSFEHFAQASEEEVMNAWAGLGYYSRARNLLKAAREVAAHHGGELPGDEKSLLNLPGIGPYTAAAIAAIAFGRRAVVMDGNVERVMARYHGIDTPLPHAKPVLKQLADKHTPHERAGDYAQAVMDLGATICTPKSPKCLICPVRSSCRAHFLNKEEAFPVKGPKKAKPSRRGLAFFVLDAGNIFLVRRPPKGLLGSMLALPSSPWETDLSIENAFQHAPQGFQGKILPGHVEHVFTHFRLELHVAVGQVSHIKTEGQWLNVEKAIHDLPSVMKKAVRYAQAAL